MAGGMGGFGAMLAGLMGGGNGAAPGTLGSVLGGGGNANPAMTGGLGGLMPPGMMLPGMGVGSMMPGMPGAGAMPGGGVQMPEQQGAMAGLLAQLGQMGAGAQTPMAQALLRMGPQMLQAGQQQQQLQTPGALPVAGPGAQRNDPRLTQGYMAAGGGVAPRRIMR